MKAFIAISLVCYLGAASAGLISKTTKLGKFPSICREQAYMKAVMCNDTGTKNGTATVECLAAVVVTYMKCIEDFEPNIENFPLFGGSANATEIAPANKFKWCIANFVLDTLKCIVNDQLSRGWLGIIKCIATNIPELLKCFPKKP